MVLPETHNGETGLRNVDSSRPARVFQWNAALSPLGGTRSCTLEAHSHGHRGQSSFVLKIHKVFQSQYSFLLGLYGHQSGVMSQTINLTSEPWCFAADGGFLHFLFQFCSLSTFISAAGQGFAPMRAKTLTRKQMHL